MKRRASLMLMEMLIMILVFSLAAAVCMQVFARSYEISRESEKRDEAIVLARNGAGSLKACAGDAEAAANLLGGEVWEDGFRLTENGLEMTVTILSGDIPGLGMARIEVRDTASGRVLVSLETGWQEVAE